jgi:hypothetical protein
MAGGELVSEDVRWLELEEVQQHGQRRQPVSGRIRPSHGWPWAREDLSESGRRRVVQTPRVPVAP